MASPVRVSVVLRHNGFAPLAKALESRGSIIVRKTAMDVAAAAQNNTHRIRFAFMKNGFRNEARGPLTEVIFNTQDYFSHHEMGTIHISAAPMLVPAMDRARPSFQAAVGQLFASAT